MLEGRCAELGTPLHDFLEGPGVALLSCRKSANRRAMSKSPQRIRGTQDIFGEDADRFQAVVSAFERVRRLYAFQRVEMPVFEATEVFARSIGETTDVVSRRCTRSKTAAATV
jgi:hypothetical protein